MDYLIAAWWWGVSFNTSFDTFHCLAMFWCLQLLLSLTSRSVQGLNSSTPAFEVAWNTGGMVGPAVAIAVEARVSKTPVQCWKAVSSAGMSLVRNVSVLHRPRVSSSFFYNECNCFPWVMLGGIGPPVCVEDTPGDNALVLRVLLANTAKCTDWLPHCTSPSSLKVDLYNANSIPPSLSKMACHQPGHGES